MLNKKSQESSVEFNRILFADDILIIGKASNPAGITACRIRRFLDATAYTYIDFKRVS